MMNRRTDTTGAQVRLWPPALFAVPFAAAAALHRRRPWPAPIRWRGRLWRVVGGGLIAGGVVLMGRSMAVLHGRGTTVMPWRQVEELVTDGPFSRVRNPIYAADLLVYLGGTVLIRSAWPLVALPAVLHILRRRVIDPEETYLRRRFGAKYAAYLRSTPRLLPRLETG